MHHLLVTNDEDYVAALRNVRRGRVARWWRRHWESTLHRARDLVHHRLLECNTCEAIVLIRALSTRYTIASPRIKFAYTDINRIND